MAMTYVCNPLRPAELIEIFDGGIVPQRTQLGNILLRNHGISSSACEACANIFDENLSLMGLLNDRRELNMFSDPDSMPVEDIPDEFEETIEPETTHVILDKGDHQESRNTESRSNRKTEIPNDAPPFDGDWTPYNVPIKDRRVARLILPSDVTVSDLTIIQEFVSFMKRTLE